MGNQWFQFKEFLIKQDKTAMKVGTDGTLLGAWTNVPETGKVLDIGTGTGLLALMVAQQSREPIITALEVEENAYMQANENIANSKWNDRIKVIKGSFIDFAKKSDELYDLIICNPPFYKTRNPGEDKNRAIARHSSSLEINDLIFYAQKLLKNNGIFSLILPAEQLDSASKIAQNESLFLQRLIFIKPTPNKKPHRILLQFGRIKTIVDKEELIIEEFGRHQYSDKFKSLVEPFYLSFRS